MNLPPTFCTYMNSLAIYVTPKNLQAAEREQPSVDVLLVLPGGNII